MATIARGSITLVNVADAQVLDWIQDWDSNKTSVGGTYLITPKIFAGKKIESEEGVSSLTGVYIGPNYNNGAGIYGYKEGEKIFHIDENGSSIGGWIINTNSIQTSDGSLKLLSEGSVIASNSANEVLWGLYKNGDATFAGGNVKLYANGNAEFKGTITSSEGYIGNWKISGGSLCSANICLDSQYNYIGVASRVPVVNGGSIDGRQHKNYVQQYGGIYMCHNSATSYGLVGYLYQTGLGENVTPRQVFYIGYTNFIAGWNFDDEAIYVGTKSSSAAYTSNAGSITISKLGILGHKWKLLQDGSGAIAGGNISWDKDGKVTFSSEVSLSWSQGISQAQASANTAQQLAQEATSSVSSMSGKLTYIGADGIYSGTLKGDQIIAGTISTVDIKQSQEAWVLNQDGSGKLANGNIEWDKDGNTHVRGLFSQELTFIGDSDAGKGMQLVDNVNRYKVTLNKDLYVVFNAPEEWGDYDANNNDFYVVLPDDLYYIGKEIKIYDVNYGPYTRDGWSIRDTRVASSMPLMGFPPVYASDLTYASGYDSVVLLGGYLHFVGTPSSKENENNEWVPCTQWLCVGFSGQQVYGIKDNRQYLLSFAYTN